ncbi:hypothetical protein O181_056413 [Austropuccinia psidii MF-1]|uniref:Reverse transcriptase Ty1/copia-type domain-containing protein n=1 Tax=Austropuccinia psidii MF-1 TaxID=1389203 RepID=A0A9Q3HTE8_9BASI|nr:hypothetical protein [Austropuccinia psidii MF-1]
MAIFGRNVQPIKDQVNREFRIKGTGLASFLLGVKIQNLEEGITLDQQHFIDSLLDLYGRKNCKSITTPLVTNENIRASTEEEEEESFRNIKVNLISAMGSINYLSTATFPGLSHAVSSLSQNLERLGILHWKVFLHVFKYLCRTLLKSARHARSDCL